MGLNIVLDRRRARVKSIRPTGSYPYEDTHAEYADLRTPFDGLEVKSPLRRKTPKRSKRYE